MTCPKYRSVIQGFSLIAYFGSVLSAFSYSSSAGPKVLKISQPAKKFCMFSSYSNSDKLTIPFIDSHCHLHLSNDGQIYKPLVCACTMGTEESDWSEVLNFHMTYPDESFTYGLGLHPWFIDNRSPEWSQTLENLIETNSNAIVGEIGLDRTRRGGRWCDQVECFEAQLRLAARHSRPASLHCVRAWGALEDTLRNRLAPEELPPRLSLHSYTGSPETAASLLRIPGVGERLYFGFSHGVNLSSEGMRKKLAAIVVKVPRERVLAETDLHACRKEEHQQAMEEIIQVISTLWACSKEECAMVIRKNSEDFFALS